MASLKVHMIGNAHLDPVWMWSYQAGIDEALATAYSAVNLLDEFDDFIFTRSDVWFHQTIQRLNPELFHRIVEHVKRGRWRIVGGWYVQADCNLPTEFGFRKHIEIGKAYARDHFGVEVTVGYNPDSFGHAGTLPRILAEAGYDAYVFMRPDPNEKHLPNNVFRWQACDSEHQLLAYRIAGPYCTDADDLKDHIHLVVDQCDTSLGHVMCFYGVGDHGGGPTRRQIEYIREHANAFDGMELIFSHPQAYFDAVRDRADQLPVVVGELQHHAVGCYTVLRRLKSAVKETEHKLTQARHLAETMPQHTDPQTSQQLNEAWEDVLANQFHDTLGGTCVKSAYPAVFDQVGRARAVADEQITALTRRRSRHLAPVELSGDLLAELAVLNTDSHPFKGYIEHECFGLNGKQVRLVDADTGQEIPSQALNAEAVNSSFLRLLAAVRLAPNQLQRLRVAPADRNHAATDLKTSRTTIANTFWRVGVSDHELVLQDLTTEKAISLSWQVLEDLTDTWSHGVNHYAGPVIGGFARRRLLREESGPLRATLVWLGRFKQNAIRVRTGLYAHDPFVELTIDLFWAQQKAVLKMVIDGDGLITERLDGVPGGSHARALDGNEYPLHDWTRLTFAGNRELAVVSPDVYALDVNANLARLTLVRSPRYARHINDVSSRNDPRQFHNDFIDQGEHRYRLLIRTGKGLQVEKLQRIAYQLQQPPIHWDLPYRKNHP